MKKVFLVLSVVISNFGFSQNPVKLFETNPKPYEFRSKQSVDSLIAFTQQPIDSAGIQAEFLDLLNLYRRYNNVSELEIDSELCLAANNQCKYMVANSYVGHEQTNGKFPKLVDRFIEYDKEFDWYKTKFGENSLTVTHNICFIRNRTIAESALDLWANSKSHNQNQLNSIYTKIGISFIKSPIDNSIYSVVVFSN